MAALTDSQKQRFNTDGYLHLEGVLSAEEVAFFSAEIDRVRTLPGYEPDNNPDLPIGHYSRLPHAKSLDNDGFMDRRELLE